MKADRDQSVEHSNPAVRCARVVLPALALLALSACGREVETGYGRSRSTSVNGTGAFAGLFRARGDEVRTAVRLTDELSEWADVVVRFAPAPGPPPKDEAGWYARWLDDDPDRRLVYVARDYDATHEYWARALDQLPATAPDRTRERIRSARKLAEGWEQRLPERPKSPAPAGEWFEVKPGKPASVCEALAGPWGRGLDAKRAALTRHQTFQADGADVLLSGDGHPLVVARTRPFGGEVLVAASGVFLLNLPMTEPARWPLAARTVEWAEGGERSRNVAFVEGGTVMAGLATPPSVFALLKLRPFGWVAAQLLALGLAACLARAPRLGRARPEEASGADRPVAHPEALGALLARAGQAREARAVLDAYRRWRHGPSGGAPTGRRGGSAGPPGKPD